MVLVVVLTFSNLGFAQFKYEKETRIRDESVPENALKMIDALNFSRKVRWFKETGFDKISVEAKTKHSGRRYSIKFSENGVFEDAEIEIKTADIPAETFERINEYLLSELERFSFQKAQIQYTGNQNNVLAYLQTGQKTNDITTNFEVVVSTKTLQSFVQYEYLFSESGVFISRSQIVMRRSDNIEF